MPVVYESPQSIMSDFETPPVNSVSTASSIEPPQYFPVRSTENLLLSPDYFLSAEQSPYLIFENYDEPPSNYDIYSKIFIYKFTI